MMCVNTAFSFGVQHTVIGLHPCRITIHIQRATTISHVNRVTSNNSFSNEGGQISLNSLRGSGALAQLADTVVGVERNQQDEETKNVVHFRLLKSRVTGETGSAGYASYSHKTGLLTACAAPQASSEQQSEIYDNDDF